MPARSALAAGLFVLLSAQQAWGQDPPSPPVGGPSNNAVPRGAGGAIIKEPPKDAAPAGKPTMPRPKNYAPPEYPAEAKKQGLEGQVILELVIDATGKVTSAKVSQGAGHGFDEAAVAAAQKLDFEPARNPDGSPFSARILYRYQFKLDQAPEPPPEKAPATTGIFEGVVLAAGGDVPLAGAVVTIGGSVNLTVTTDEKGAFTLRDVPAGKYPVTVSLAGFQPINADETVSAGDATSVKYRLLPAGATVEVTVRGDRPPREVTKRTIEQREISRIAGTNGDALRSIQNLPGVARPPGIAGVLLVRGSSPQDTQIFVDGTPVPIVYHFGGLSSVIPTEVIDKIDFYPGNFSSQFGRAQGGIVDVGVRNPKDTYSGLLQADLIDVRALLEGPIPLLKGWTFLAAGRRSYLDAWLGPVLTAAGAGVTQAPVYYDYQFMAQTKPTASSSFRLMFFGSDDNLKLVVDQPAASEPALAGDAGFHTSFKRLQARFQNDFANGDQLRATVALGQDNVDVGLASLFFLLDLKTITGRLEYAKKIAKGVTANVGLDMEGGAYDVDVRLPAPPQAGAPPNGPFSTRTPTETHLKGAAFLPAAYAEMELSPDPRLRVVPGIRFDYFNINGAIDVSPRVNARFDVHKDFPRTTLKGGVGLYHQAPQFQEVTAPYGNPNLKSNRTIQYALGAEQEIATKQLELSVEGFYKQLDSLVVSNSTASGNGVAYSNSGTGYVVGAEVWLKFKPKPDDRFFGWLAYTLSRSVRSDFPGDPDHLVSFDQTHILTVLGGYRLPHGWEIGARFRLISGDLTTPNVCDVSSSGCSPLRVNALYNAPSGVYTAIPAAGNNTERLPLFHQLDLRVDHYWQFKSWKLSTYLDIQNVYNHQNVEGLSYNFNYTNRVYVSGIPILPSLGLRGEL